MDGDVADYGSRERRAHPRGESAVTCPSLDPGIGLLGWGP